MNPPQAKNESQLYDSIKRWEREMEDLEKLSGTAVYMGESLKITALKNICVGRMREEVDLRENIDGYADLRNRVMVYAAKKRGEWGGKTTTEAGGQINSIVTKLKEALKSGQPLAPAWGQYEQDNWSSCNYDYSGVEIPVPETSSEDELCNVICALIKGGKGKGKKGGGKGECWNCGRKGHQAKDCRSKGNPKGGGKWNGGKYGGKSNYNPGKGGKPNQFATETRECYNCGEKGHLSMNCSKPKGYAKGKGKGINEVAVELGGGKGENAPNQEGKGTGTGYYNQWNQWVGCIDYEQEIQCEPCLCLLYTSPSPRDA